MVPKEVNKKQDGNKKLLELLRVQRPHKTFLESAKNKKAFRMSWMGKGCEILCSLFSSWDAGPCGPTAKPTLASGLAGRSWEGF